MIKILSTLAIAGASLLSINAAQASDGWVYIGSFPTTGPTSAKVDSYVGNFVNAQLTSPTRPLTPITIDCLRWRYTLQNNGRGWSPIPRSGSLGALTAQQFCR